MSKTDKLKAALLVATLGTTPVHETSAQDISSRDDLHTEIKIDENKCHSLIAHPKSVLDERILLQQKFEHPVAIIKLPLNETRIGPFTGKNILAPNTYSPYVSNIDFNKPIIIREERPIGYVTQKENYDSMASCLGDTIRLPNWNVSPELKRILDNNPDIEAQLILGHPILQIAALNHEKLHSIHFHRKQIPSYKQDRPTDQKIEINYSTEKIATCIEYLTIANIWRVLKENGFNTVQIRNHEIPVDSIPYMYPGLGKEVRKNGFDPKYKESLINISKISSKHWDQTELEFYSNHQFNEDVKPENISLIGMLQAARDFPVIQKDMLKNINIGNEVIIDLPEETLSLFIPPKEFAHNLVTKIENSSILQKNFNNNESDDISDEKLALYASSEGLLKIDSYLDEIGCKNDAEKEQYLKTQFKKIVTRKPDADKKLCSLMLDCQYSKTTEPMIIYSDNLKLKQYKNYSRVFNEGNTLSVALSPWEEKLGTRKIPVKKNIAHKTFDATKMFSHSR